MDRFLFRKRLQDRDMLVWQNIMHLCDSRECSRDFQMGRGAFEKYLNMCLLTPSKSNSADFD